MEFQTNTNLSFITNKPLLEKVTGMTIKKYHQEVNPQKVLLLNQANKQTAADFEAYDNQKGIELQRKSSVILDFGDHCVGKVTLRMKPIGSPPDAPLKLKLAFGETLAEVQRSFDLYQGELSSSWLQEELLTIDLLPSSVRLKRRFAFRFVKITVVDTSPKYHLMLKLTCETESSANPASYKSLDIADPLLKQIDSISQKTLAHCMQDVFEDGPKRDRRLWLGDLRLQALANYQTFANNQLVKKCLYLFAAKTTEEGLVSANVFIEPNLLPDDTFLADYSLFFIDTLLAYYEQTQDEETLNDLYSTAVKQAEIYAAVLQADGNVQANSDWWAFIDWNEELDKQVAIQGVFIYAYKRLKKLAQLKHDARTDKQMDSLISQMECAALSKYYQPEQQLFSNPETNQFSLASQTWMILAEVGDAALRKNVLSQTLRCSQEMLGCNTPYMYHHYLEALFQEGFNQAAIALMKSYWGGMIQAGADTFWEVYHPNNESLSPYGDPIINSYCHAWSCTPCYLLRKYPLE